MIGLFKLNAEGVKVRVSYCSQVVWRECGRSKVGPALLPP